MTAGEWPHRLALPNAATFWIKVRSVFFLRWWRGGSTSRSASSLEGGGFICPRVLFDEDIGKDGVPFILLTVVKMVNPGLTRKQDFPTSKKCGWEVSTPFFSLLGTGTCAFWYSCSDPWPKTIFYNIIIWRRSRGACHCHVPLGGDNIIKYTCTAELKVTVEGDHKVQHPLSTQAFILKENLKFSVTAPAKMQK